MAAEQVITRQLHLEALAKFAGHLVTALREVGVAGSDLRPRLDQSLTLECAQCGITLIPEDLMALSLPAAEPTAAASTKVERLRRGYCARNGCESYYYRLLLTPAPGLDWATILARTESLAAATADEESGRRTAVAGFSRAIPWRLLGRVAAGIACVAALLMLRQWMVGGRIPFLREPEPFQVDPASLDAGTHPLDGSIQLRPREGGHGTEGRA